MTDRPTKFVAMVNPYDHNSWVLDAYLDVGQHATEAMRLGTEMHKRLLTGHWHTTDNLTATDARMVEEYSRMDVVNFAGIEERVVLANRQTEFVTQALQQFDKAIREAFLYGDGPKPSHDKPKRDWEQRSKKRRRK